MTEKELLHLVINQLKDFHCISCFASEEFGKSEVYKKNREVLDLPEVRNYFKDLFII